MKVETRSKITHSLSLRVYFASTFALGAVSSIASARTLDLFIPTHACVRSAREHCVHSVCSGADLLAVCRCLHNVRTRARVQFGGKKDMAVHRQKYRFFVCVAFTARSGTFAG